MLNLKKIPVKKSESGDKAIESLMDSYPPSIHLSDKQVPEIKNWKAGQTYQLIIQVKETSMNIQKDGRVDASFEITHYKAVTGMDEMSDKEIENMQGQAMMSK